MYQKFSNFLSFLSEIPKFPIKNEYFWKKYEENFQKKYSKFTKKIFYTSENFEISDALSEILKFHIQHWKFKNSDNVKRKLIEYKLSKISI